MKSKVPVNLENYPALMDLANSDKAEFLQLMKSLFTTANNAVREGHTNVSKEYFGISYQDLINELTGAMFDHKGIIDHLPNQLNATTINDLYGHAINPLHAAFTKDNMLNTAGETVSFVQKFGIEDRDFTVKKWLQGLLFYSYYCDLPSLAQYLALNDYSLVDEEKSKNIAKLVELRPILDYQKRIGILPGKLIPNTGFFDAGDLKEEECPACQVPDSLLQLSDQLTVCTKCKGGFTYIG